MRPITAAAATLLFASLLLTISGFSVVNIQESENVFGIPLAEPATIEEITATPEDIIRATQIECLARNIYFEARGESPAGQMAVGQVTINRSKQEEFPDSICGVVHQKSQFSWLWDGKPDKITQPKVYAGIELMAEYLYDDYYVNQRVPDLVNGAAYFHTRWINPRWKNMVVVARIDNHVFLKRKLKA